MPRPRHQRQPSQVLPPELISGVDPSQILDFGQAVARTVSGQPHKATEAATNVATAAAVLQRSKTSGGQEGSGSGSGHFPQLPKTPPST
ncbi:hypothetical protein SDJN03_15589, partial [Cucurbita argyrosperma subsp. sororia]